MRVAIQGFRAADVAADRCDQTADSPLSDELAAGDERSGHRGHVEERQNSVHDSGRGWSLP
jgi:hypothetical protein